MHRYATHRLPAVSVPFGYAVWLSDFNLGFEAFCRNAKNRHIPITNFERLYHDGKALRALLSYKTTTSTLAPTPCAKHSTVRHHFDLFSTYFVRSTKIDKSTSRYVQLENGVWWPPAGCSSASSLRSSPGFLACIRTSFRRHCLPCSMTRLLTRRTGLFHTST